MPESPKMPRTFASRAYLREVDPGTFLLFRSIEVETTDGGREKQAEIQVSPRPLRRFDPKTDDERQVVLKTVHPSTAEVLHLVEVGDH
jgi:hypothetical protein